MQLEVYKYLHGMYSVPYDSLLKLSFVHVLVSCSVKLLWIRCSNVLQLQMYQEALARTWSQSTLLRVKTPPCHANQLHLLIGSAGFFQPLGLLIVNESAMMEK